MKKSKIFLIATTCVLLAGGVLAAHKKWDTATKYYLNGTVCTAITCSNVSSATLCHGSDQIYSDNTCKTSELFYKYQP